MNQQALSNIHVYYGISPVDELPTTTTIFPPSPYYYPWPAYPEKKPHLCPVCMGEGTITKNDKTKKCHGCDGRGLIIC